MTDLAIEVDFILSRPKKVDNTHSNPFEEFGKRIFWIQRNFYKFAFMKKFKMKNKMNLIILLLLCYTMNSCTGIRGIDDLYWKLTPTYRKFKAETAKEREFVQKLIDNPEQMIELIEKSEYFNPEYFERTFPEFYIGTIDFMKRKTNLEISDFYKVALNYYRYNHLVQKMYAIDVKRKCHSHYDEYISFAFAEINDKVILIDIGHFLPF